MFDIFHNKNIQNQQDGSSGKSIWQATLKTWLCSLETTVKKWKERVDSLELSSDCSYNTL